MFASHAAQVYMRLRVRQSLQSDESDEPEDQRLIISGVRCLGSRIIAPTQSYMKNAQNRLDSERVNREKSIRSMRRRDSSVSIFRSRTESTGAER